MRVIVPNYYKDFKCIADKCHHTCCAGWEIDVDEKSLKRFASLPEIYSHISDGQIVLCENDCCPFLKDDGLCHMILKYGEDMLCDICKDHPRFRNFYDDFIEMGLGLTCEAASKLIIDFEETFKLVDLENPEIYLELSDELTIITNRTTDIISRLNQLYLSDIDSSKRATIFLNLERLDDTWTNDLKTIIDNPVSSDERIDFIRKNPIKFEQLTAYFLYRHESNSHFAVESVNLIADLCVRGMNIYEASRKYSSEVEYSDTNIDILLYDEFI